MDSSDDQSEHSQEESESSVEEGSSNDDSQDEEDDVPKLADDEFKEIPFEDLLKLQKKLGTRMYNEAIFGKSSDKPSQAEATKSPKKRKFEPDCFNSESDDDSGPEEVSARRKMPQNPAKTKKRNYDEGNQRPRDPRFDPQQGYFNGRKFREDYGFVNDMRTKELKKLQNRMQSVTDPEEGTKLKFLVQRTENQIREYAKQRKLDETKRQEKQQARQAIQDGKRPFYERKSTKKARELVERYDQLKQDGKLAKHIDKRRKKVSAKDRKKLDFST